MHGNRVLLVRELEIADQKIGCDRACEPGKSKQQETAEREHETAGERGI
jgi:hypothetical protein